MRIVILDAPRLDWLACGQPGWPAASRPPPCGGGWLLPPAQRYSQPNGSYPPSVTVHDRC